MELCVHLKVCEGCGCLWLRPQFHRGVYCSACTETLREFPAPLTRKRRGPRRGHKPLSSLWTMAEAGGAA